MCSLQNVNTLGGSRNKLAAKKSSKSLLEKTKHPERDFWVFVRVAKVDVALVSGASVSIPRLSGQTSVLKFRIVVSFKVLDCALHGGVNGSLFIP